MRMGVGIGDSAVCCPPGMTDAAGRRIVVTDGTQILYLSSGLANRNPSVILKPGDSSAVIATILQFFQTLQ